MKMLRSPMFYFVCVATVLSLQGVALGDEAKLSPGFSLRERGLVIEGAPEESQQIAAELAARHESPEVAAAREASRTEYEGLGASAAGRLLAKSQPTLVGVSEGGLPALSAGEKIVSFVSDYAARVSLPRGKQGIVESTSPLAVKASGDHRHLPIDLRLRESKGGFEPRVPLAHVRIPRWLDRGPSLVDVNVSLVPVDSRGSVLGHPGGVLTGASVLYGDTEHTKAGVRDMDTLVKPSMFGFMLETSLRSRRSPEDLFFRVGMPAGARLVEDQRSGAARVVLRGATLAAILPPGAHDATGMIVPASMSVTGNMIKISAAHRSGSYLYPIVVDPEVNDSQLATTSGSKRSNWEFLSSNETEFGHSAVYEGPGKERLETTGIKEYLGADYAYWAYQTKGNSKIYEVKTKTSGKNKSAKIESFLQFQAGGVNENKKNLSNEFEEPEYIEKVSTICAWNASKVEECLPGSGKEANVVRFQQSTTGSSGANYKFSDVLSEGTVQISEPAGEHSTTSFNTTSPEIEGEVEVEGKKVLQKRLNVLYGAHGWLTKYQDALGLIAKDPGIGVAVTRFEYEKAGVWEQLAEHNYLEKENACQGVQCYAQHEEYWTLDPKLPDGEDKIRYRAEEAIGSSTESLAAEGKETIKVDGSAPHEIYLNGLPWGNELSEKPYKLVGEATDGEGTTVASSGIKNIALLVSGKEIPEIGKQVGCSKATGKCTAKAEWSINGAELGAGHHAIVEIATDNAGNEARIEETISVRHSTPVSLGPGSVDPESGDFSLGATDVSMGSGLTVARTYSSRSLNPGIEGPLGKQWGLSMGGSESLVELVDGSVLLTSPNGGQSIFASVGSNKFESPTGDSNLTLTSEENPEKHKIAYFLKDPTKGTVTKFTLPSGGLKTWVPTRQEGPVATDTVTYSYQTAVQSNEYPISLELIPQEITTGPDGNLWFTDALGSIVKISTAGVVTEYLSGNLEKRGIVTGPDGNLWFTEAEGKIGEMTTSGKLTEYLIEKFTSLYGITVGPDQNLWVAGFKYMYKIDTSGAVLAKYPLPSQANKIVSGPDGNLWFTGNNKIGKITMSGVVTEYTLPSEGYLEGLAVGPDKNLWYTIASANVVGKITTSGVATEYHLSTKSKPFGITAGTDGNLWVASYETKTIVKMTTAGTVTEYPVSAEVSPYEITAGPDGDIWFTDYFGEVGTMATVTEPTEALAPVPAGVSCAPELKAGCRSLKFKYATGTTAKGEPQSEWGEYKGHLSEVLLDTYNPSTKKMQETIVAEYQYDKQGRLRAEWDPRISPALKTTYGYDAEGHVTALSPPGQQPWLFNYGTTAGEASTGRLLSLTRPSASTSPEPGVAAPVNTVVPALSSAEAGVGVTLSVSNGAWSNNPLSYGYQWLECSASGTECAAIPGATNQSYRPASSDVGHVIQAEVRATNSNGTATTSGNASNAVASVLPPTYLSKFGSEGSGNGQFKSSILGTVGAGMWDATDSAGNLWVTDPGNNRVQKFSSSGEYIAQFGASGTGNGQFKEPQGIAIDSEGHLYVVDKANSRVQEFSSFGEYIRQFGSTGAGNGQFKEPEGVAIDSEHHVVVVDSGNNRIEQFSSTGEYIRKFGAEGTGTEQFKKPQGIAIKGLEVYVVDTGNNRVQMLYNLGSYFSFGRFGASGTGNGQFKEPRGIAMDASGRIWVTDTNNYRIEEFSSSGSYLIQFGLKGTGNGQFKNPEGLAFDKTGHVWVADAVNNRVQELALPVISEGPPAPPTLGSSAVTTLEYDVPISGTGAPHAMSPSDVEKWGQQDDPVEATSILPPDSPQGWPASNYTRATTYYLDAEGRMVNVANPNNSSYGSISTTEYNEENDVARTLGPDNRVAALEAGAKSGEVANLLDTQYTYNDPECRKGTPKKEKETAETGTRLCETWGPQHEVKYLAGSEQKEALARNHTKYFYEDTEHGASTGEKYDLVTETSTIADLANEEEVEVRKTATSYSGQSNVGWKLRAPTSVTEDPEGKKITQTTLYNSTTGQITETRGAAGSSGESAHDSKIIYYTTAANTEGYTACGGHPEWATLVCETLPAKQPGAGAPPKLPVTITTYNVWNEPETVTETFGTVTRTKKNTYDGAGRLVTSETSSSADTPLPKVTDEYESKTGVLEKQSTTVEGKTKTVTDRHNTLGQPTEYTDADGNIAKYRYGGPSNDGLLEEVADGSAVGTGKQTYTYNATTKLREQLVDSAAGTFSASYDADGKLTSETYPNAMCTNDTYNSVGEATRIEYIKTATCSEHEAPVWFSETRSPSVRGEVFSRTSTLASETYVYDTVGRLTETQETPAGEGCRTRLYEYDEESNRTSQTTRVPGGGSKCATEGGILQGHTYDEGNRLIDEGIEYDSLGNVTKLPAADAEGHELSSTFYADNAVASQSQNGVTNNYYLDPDGRVRETVSSGKLVLTHYDGPGEAAAWTSESAEKWTRNIPGIDGTLAAVQTNGETPVLQLHDLQGNIFATAALSGTATKLLSTYSSTEFGVPNAGKAPPTFAWLGANDIASTLSSGVITYGATSYVPQTGRPLQTEQVEPPGAPGGAGAGAPYIWQEEPWVMQGAAAEAAEAPGLEADREQAAFQAALLASDPKTYVSMHRLKAENLGKELEAIGSIGEFLNVFLNIPGDIEKLVEGDLIEHFEHIEQALGWFRDAGQKLIKCGNNKSVFLRICKFEYDEFKFSEFGLTLEFPNPWGMWPVVEECYPEGSDMDCVHTVHVPAGPEE
jgi:streptogramin lyase